LLLQPRSCLCAEVRSSPAAQGQAGNAVQYITRNQALKKLQLKLSEFRWRLHAGLAYVGPLHCCTSIPLQRASKRHHVN